MRNLDHFRKLIDNTSDIKKKKEYHIKKLILEYNDMLSRQDEISLELLEYYKPIISELKDNKDEDSLEELLFIIPDTPTILLVYKSLREIRKPY